MASEHNVYPKNNYFPNQKKKKFEINTILFLETRKKADKFLQKRLKSKSYNKGLVSRREREKYFSFVAFTALANL